NQIDDLALLVPEQRLERVNILAEALIQQAHNLRRFSSQEDLGEFPRRLPVFLRAGKSAHPAGHIVIAEVQNAEGERGRLARDPRGEPGASDRQTLPSRLQAVVILALNIVTVD